jgi:crossover junction endodeoxyribonuclease RuvC
MSHEDVLDEVNSFMESISTGFWERSVPIFLGIDPGSTGAIAFLHPGGNKKAIAIDIPTTKVMTKKKGKPSYRTKTDLGALWDIFKSFEDNFSKLHVVIEQQQPIPRDTALTGFTVGSNFGMWPLFLYSHGISHETIRPVAWKKQMSLIRKDKEAARLKAQQMFPGASLSRKKDHNRAEALLIAECIRLRSMER